MECNFENCPNFERLGKKFADRISELEQENAELKAENEALIEGLGVTNKYVNKYHQTLQEIKTIAECCMAKDACFECKYWDDCRIEDAEIPTYDICKLVLQLITKAEEE